MSNIDKREIHNQQLKAFITGFLSDPAHDNQSSRSLTAEVFRIALASLEAEADAVCQHQWKSGGANKLQRQKQCVKCGRVEFSAPPAPVSVPDELTREEYKRRFMEEDNFDDTFRDGWNSCRAAMLQGAEPVTTDYKLPEGWVAVPVEPTEDMIVNGFESEPDESFSDEKVWEEYDAMSGCQQAAHRAKLCWAAMIAAAPKPEVK